MPSDAGLQALLDPDTSRRGVQILRIAIPDSTNTAYYVQALASAAGNINGKAMWVNCTTTDSDALKNTAIRAALGVP
jgi:hypothetical protein